MCLNNITTLESQGGNENIVSQNSKLKSKFDQNHLEQSNFEQIFKSLWTLDSIESGKYKI